MKLLLLLIIAKAQAATPLWTFIPQTSVELTLTNNGSAEVIYTVQNQSAHPKTLVMIPIAGITQNGVCQLPGRGTCTLRLSIQGAALQGDVLGGPVLCQQGNLNQCYQPSILNSLRIHLLKQPPIQQYTVLPLAGLNGTITPNQTQVVNAGSNLTFTATPNAGFTVKHWLLDGAVVQTGGTSFQLNNINANHSLTVVFGQSFAYVTNDFGSGANNITRCSFDNTGNFTNCTIVGAGFSNPFSLSFNPDRSRVYVANFNGNTITKCDIDTNGEFINCSNSAAIFNNPVDIIFNPAGTQIYITNIMGNRVTRCGLDIDGNLINCLNAGAVISPKGITFNPEGSRVYMASSSQVIKCDVGINGDLINCSLAGAGFTVPIGIAFNSSGTRLYVVNGPFGIGSVDQCEVDSNGNLINCIQAASTGNTSRFLVLNANEALAYITNATDDNVTKCEVSVNGNLINCTVTGFNMNGATGIRLVVL